MNNKGFMMAEVVVVSAIILVTLVGLYSSYSKIFSLYNQRVDYYDVTTLYELANIRNYSLDTLTVGSNNVDGDIIFFVDKNDVKNKNINTDSLNQTFKDYLDYLSTSVDFDSLKIGESEVTNILIMENCSDENNCKYAYLEVLGDE